MCLEFSVDDGNKMNQEGMPRSLSLVVSAVIDKITLLSGYDGNRIECNTVKDSIHAMFVAPSRLEKSILLPLENAC